MIHRAELYVDGRLENFIFADHFVNQSSIIHILTTSMNKSIIGNYIGLVVQAEKTPADDFPVIESVTR